MLTKTDIHLFEGYSQLYHLAKGRAFLFLKACPLCVSPIINTWCCYFILHSFHFLRLVKSKEGKRTRFNRTNAADQLKSYYCCITQPLTPLFSKL